MAAGWSQMGGLLTGRQMSVGASAPPADPPPPLITTSDPPQLGSVGSQAAATSSKGYTTVTVAERSGTAHLLAGTGDARLRWLDVERSELLADALCWPSS